MKFFDRANFARVYFLVFLSQIFRSLAGRSHDVGKWPTFWLAPYSELRNKLPYCEQRLDQLYLSPKLVVAFENFLMTSGFTYVLHHDCWEKFLYGVLVCRLEFSPEEDGGYYLTLNGVYPAFFEKEIKKEMIAEQPIKLQKPVAEDLFV